VDGAGLIFGENGKLVLYDTQTARVSDLASFPDSVGGDDPAWSGDGRFIYIDAPLASDPAIYRIRIADTHMERVASLKGVQRAKRGHRLLNRAHPGWLALGYPPSARLRDLRLGLGGAVVFLVIPSVN